MANRCSVLRGPRNNFAPTLRMRGPPGEARPKPGAVASVQVAARTLTYLQMHDLNIWNL